MGKKECTEYGTLQSDIRALPYGRITQKWLKEDPADQEEVLAL